MSDEEEEKQRLLAQLRIGRHKISVTAGRTYQCEVVVSFETKTKDDADGVITRLSGMRVFEGESLAEQAVEVLRKDLEGLEEAKAILVREHKARVAQLLLESGKDKRELDRLHKLESDLVGIAALGKPPVVR